MTFELVQHTVIACPKDEPENWFSLRPVWMLHSVPYGVRIEEVWLYMVYTAYHVAKKLSIYLSREVFLLDKLLIMIWYYTLTTSTGWSSAESRQTPLSCSCYSGCPSGTSLHHIYHSTGSSRNISQQSALTGKTRYRLQPQLSFLRHSPRSAAERKTGRY